MLPPCCFVLILCTRRAHAPALRFMTICGAPPYCLFSPFVSYGRFVNRPYGTEQNIICRGDHILAKQVCHEAKRNIESPVTLFAPSFGFAQTNAPSQTSVGEGLAPPVLCSLYLLASYQQTITLKLCRGRRPRRPVTLFALSFFCYNLCSHSTKVSPV